MAPYKRNMGQKLNTDVNDISVDYAFVAHFQIPAAKAVAQDLVSAMAAVALTDATQTITTGLTGPAIPRSLRVKGNAAGIAGNVVVTGTNYAGNTITETFALDGSNAVEGSKAFKTITQVVLPMKTNESSDTVSIGFGNKLGLPYKLAHNTIMSAFRDNAKEGTAPTVTVSTTAMESNTVLLNSALTGTVIDIYLLV